MMANFNRRATQNSRRGSPAISVRAVFMASLPEAARATGYKKPFIYYGLRLLASVASTFNKLRKKKK